MSFIKLGIGDIGHTIHSYLKTVGVDAGVSIIKGNVYTKDSDGNLIDLTAGSGVVAAGLGRFQALASSPAVASEAAGSRKVQCMIARSRVILKGPVNLVAGQSVEMHGSGSTVNAAKVQAYSTGTKLGVIHSLLNGNAKTANNDLIFIDMGLS